MGSRSFNVIELVTNRKGICDLLLVVMYLGRISDSFGATAIYWLKVASETHCCLIYRPHYRVTLANMLMKLILPKTRINALPISENIILRSFMSTQYRRVADGWSDTQTYGRTDRNAVAKTVLSIAMHCN